MTKMENSKLVTLISLGVPILTLYAITGSLTHAEFLVLNAMTTEYTPIGPKLYFR